jgi:hypothetical protein
VKSAVRVRAGLRAAFAWPFAAPSVVVGTTLFLLQQ